MASRPGNVRRRAVHLAPARRVALAFPARFAHLPGIVHGITDYARAHGRWLLTTGAELFGLPIGDLRKWNGDGVIAALGNAEDVAAARRMKIPVVTMFGMVRSPGVPRVMVDQAQIGRLAAEHLVSRGFRRFAFYGLRGPTYSADREQAFIARVAQHGGTVARCHSPANAGGRRPWDEIERLRRWVARLTTPVGVFAANDQRARMLVDAAELAGRRVPDEVGVIGVDNDEIACEFGEPTLTSIACDWAAVGFETAELLDRLMNGEKPPAGDLLIRPTGVVTRETTDVIVTDHPAVARAVAFARDHRGEPFGVEALVGASGVSRRHLELSFARSLGCTPADFLARIRAEQAKELLDQGGRTLTQIARLCGFSDLRQFSRVFARVMNSSPRKYQQGGRAPSRNGV
jgi:LacI family transcriptional regulator